MSGPTDIILASCGRYHLPALATEYARMGRLRSMHTLGVRLLAPKGVSFRQYDNDFISALERRFCQRLGVPYSLAEEAKRFSLDIADKLLNQAPAILHGWNGVMNPAFRRLEGRGWVRCVERSCPHNQVQFDLLHEEGERLGIPHVQEMDALKSSIEELYLADVISVPSSYSAESYADPVLRAKVRVNTLGSNYVYRERQMRKGKGLRILMVGNDFLRKGSHYLIEAFRLLDLPDAELWIRGGIPPAYAARIRDPRIRIIGELFPAQLDALYRDADVFVQPSIDEGFGMTVLEGLARGLPLVVTENVGARDVLTDEVAVTVPIRDPEALAKGILKAKILNGPSFDQARRRILQSNSWKACAERMLSHVYADSNSRPQAVTVGDKPPVTPQADFIH